MVYCGVKRIYYVFHVPGSAEDSSLSICSAPVEGKESPLHTMFGALIFPEGFFKHCSIGLLMVKIGL